MSDNMEKHSFSTGKLQFLTGLLFGLLLVFKKEKGFSLFNAAITRTITRLKSGTLASKKRVFVMLLGVIVVPAQ